MLSGSEHGLTAWAFVGEGEWESYGIAERHAWLRGVTPGLEAADKARIARELLELTGNRELSVSVRSRAALTLAHYAHALGLMGSDTLARALGRIIEAEFMGGPAGRRRPGRQARSLRAAASGVDLRYCFLLLLLAALLVVHRPRGRRVARRLARLAPGTRLQSWVGRALNEGMAKGRLKPNG